MIGNVGHLMITTTKERVVGFMISSIAATEDVRTRRFLFFFLGGLEDDERSGDRGFD